MEHRLEKQTQVIVLSLLLQALVWRPDMYPSMELCRKFSQGSGNGNLGKTKDKLCISALDSPALGVHPQPWSLPGECQCVILKHSRSLWKFLPLIWLGSSHLKLTRFQKPLGRVQRRCGAFKSHWGMSSTFGKGFTQDPLGLLVRKLGGQPRLLPALPPFPGSLHVSTDCTWPSLKKPRRRRHCCSGTLRAMSQRNWFPSCLIPRLG